MTMPERRFHIRHRARTEVRVKTKGGRSKLCRVTNLSAQGVAIQTSDMGLSIGEVVELSFIINLGLISKIHRRSARVIHIRNGITGFAMEKYAGK